MVFEHLYHENRKSDLKNSFKIRFGSFKTYKITKKKFKKIKSIFKIC